MDQFVGRQMSVNSMTENKKGHRRYYINPITTCSALDLHAHYIAFVTFTVGRNQLFNTAIPIAWAT